MKGIFKRMKGRTGKKGSSLIAVMTTMAVLSIVALCAAGIALTNYRTTKTYVAQDSYYYSAESGQAQFVANINDVAYDFSSKVDTWTEDKVKELYNAILTVDFDLSDVVYNGKYTVENSIDQLYDTDGDGSAIFTINTTVTNIEDGSTQKYASEIKVKNPMGGSSDSYIKNEFVKNEDNDAVENLFNTGFAVVTESSASNTSWYGLWGNFNTYTTAKLNKTSPYNSSTKKVNQSGAAKLLTVTDTSSSSKDTATGTSALYLAMATTDGAESSPKKNNLFFNTAGSYLANTDAADLHNKFFNDVNGLDIDIQTAIGLYKFGADGVDKNTDNKITLLYANRDQSQKYYANHNGDLTIGFNYTPAEDVAQHGGVSLDSVQSWKESDSAYRVVFKQTGKFNIFDISKTIKHQIAYKYKNGSSYQTNGVYTYPDHYYKNKWFFIDLGGTGTLYLENSTSTTKTRDVDYDYEWHRWFGWLPILQGTKTVTEYACTDAYDNYNYPSLGNIVMEDCYFFVNGNISIANAYNLSNCKVFATGDILLEKVYYLEGLLSLETEAGSPTIEQSLYYCEGMFVSELVSRYAMNWCLKFSTGNSYWKLEDGNDAEELRGTTYADCMIQNACTYQLTTTSFVGFMPVTIKTDGYLATFRYPTVLKATIIAMGEGSFKPDSAESDKPDAVVGSGAKTDAKQYDDVSVVLNPDGSTYGVVDCVLIEGQIFSQGRIYSTNYNYMAGARANGVTVDPTNRYSASSQIQYQPYTAGGVVDDNSSFEDVFDVIEKEVIDGSSATINTITIENGGIMKK